VHILDGIAHTVKVKPFYIRHDSTLCDIYFCKLAVVGHFMDNEGVALYPIQSWVNHSCVPNCEVKFPEKNHRIGLIATEDISAGDELTISYLDLADLTRSRYSRNKYLRYLRTEYLIKVFITKLHETVCKLKTLNFIFTGSIIFLSVNAPNVLNKLGMKTAQLMKMKTTCQAVGKTKEGKGRKVSTFPFYHFFKNSTLSVYSSLYFRF